jgi:polyhydroxybutyrate depolymerase
LTEGEHGLTLDGLERRFVVRLPVDYDPARAYPVVFSLPGNGGALEEWDQTDGDKALRTVMGADGILVATEAIDKQWRDYSMPEKTWPGRIEQELLYFDAVIGQVGDGLCVDLDHLFALGFSGGGSFSGVLGCRRSDIRAIATGGAVIYFDPADCVSTPSAWVTLGALEYSDSRAAFRDFWRDGASCAETSLPTGPDSCLAYDGCAPDLAVHYCPHEGDHVWPSFGTQSAWDFFQAIP